MVRKARKSDPGSAKRACAASAASRKSAGRSPGAWVGRAGGGVGKGGATRQSGAERCKRGRARRQVGAQDLRVGELRARGEILLAVEPNAHTIRGAPAPALALRSEEHTSE